MLADAWPGLTLLAPVEAEHRNVAWAGACDGERVVVRNCRGSVDSVSWELDLLGSVSALGVGVAEVVPTVTGESHACGVAQRWVDGRLPSERWERQLVADRLGGPHAASTGSGSSTGT